MKVLRAGVLCALAFLGSVLSVRAQGGVYPAKLSLTCTTTNASGFVKTKITEKDIIAHCAAHTAQNPADLRFLFSDTEFVVANIVTTNLSCNVLAVDTSDSASNVLLNVDSGTKVAGFGVLRIFSTTEGALPADFDGNVLITFAGTESTNKPTLKLSGKVQAGSVSSNVVYTGTITVSGKPFLVD